MPTSRHLWCRDFLQALSAPGSFQNALAVIAQMAAEGGSQGAKFNPLNTTREHAGATAFNTITLADGSSIHVWNYPSYQAGLDATAQTMRQANMASLLGTLRVGTSAESYWTVLGLSPWGTHPPGGLTIPQWLADVQHHWYERVMVPISGS